jgi:uncharacterized tellurite resistance protein B-like protein
MDQCLNFLQKLPPTKKDYLAQLLQDIARADGFIHDKEKELMLRVFASVGIGGAPKKFN